MIRSRHGRGATLSFCFSGLKTAALPLLLAVQTGSHCPGTPPNVTLTLPATGTSVQSACYPDFGNFCQVDTFYVDTLRSILASRFQSAQYVFSVLLDSLGSRLVFDSVIVNGQFLYEDTLVEEILNLQVLQRYKGNIPEPRLVLKDTLPYYPPGFTPTTYRGLVDTAFLVFVQDSTYDSPARLGIGPTDGCFFEPTAFMLIQGNIHKKGFETDRMPGVSASLEKFLADVSPATIPGVMTIDVKSNSLPFGLGKSRIRKIQPVHNPAP